MASAAPAASPAGAMIDEKTVDTTLDRTRVVRTRHLPGSRSSRSKDTVRPALLSSNIKGAVARRVYNQVLLRIYTTYLPEWC